jgi:hypothetical protein
MTRKTRRFPRLAIAVVVVGLMAPAGALALPSDYRSPDGVDGAIQVQQSQQAEQSPTSGPVDLRSPDAVDAGIQVQQSQQAEQSPTSRPVDLRSPDAVDPRFVQAAEPTIVASSGGGFDWGDAGIGAGAALGLLLIGLSVMFTVTHHRNSAATV